MDTYRTPFLGLRRPHVGQGGGIPFPSLTPCLAAADRQPSVGSQGVHGTVGRSFGLSGTRTPQETPLSRLGLSEDVSESDSLPKSSEKSHVSPVMTVHPPMVSPLPLRTATMYPALYPAQGTTDVRPGAPARSPGSPLWPSVANPSTFHAAPGLRTPATLTGGAHTGDTQGRSRSLQYAPPTSAGDAGLTGGRAALRFHSQSISRMGSLAQGEPRPASPLAMPTSEASRTVTWGEAHEPSGALPSGAAPRFPRAFATQRDTDRSHVGGRDGVTLTGGTQGFGLQSAARIPIDAAAGRDGASPFEEGLEAWQDLQMPAPPTQTYGTWNLPGHERTGYTSAGGQTQSQSQRQSSRAPQLSLFGALQGLRIGSGSSLPTTLDPAVEGEPGSGLRPAPVAKSRAVGAGLLQISSQAQSTSNPEPTSHGKEEDVGTTVGRVSTNDTGPLAAEDRAVLGSDSLSDAISTANHATEVSPPSSEDLDAAYVMVPPQGLGADQDGTASDEDGNSVVDYDDDAELVDALDALEVAAGVQASDLTDVKVKLSLLGIIPALHLPKPSLPEWGLPSPGGAGVEERLKRLRGLQSVAEHLLPASRVLDTQDTIPKEAAKPILRPASPEEEVEEGPTSPVGTFRGVPSPPMGTKGPSTSSKAAEFAHRLARLQALQNVGNQLTASMELA